MPSQSPSDRPSSIDPRSGRDRLIRAGLFATLAGATTAAAAAGGALVSGRVGVAAAGLAGAGWVAALAHGKIGGQSERLHAYEQWQTKLRSELVGQSAFLDRLVRGLDAVSESLVESRVLDSTAEQARTVLGADVAVVLVPDADGRRLRPAAARGVALGPMADIAVEFEAPGSPLAEAARSRTAAAGGREVVGEDDLCRHLRPTSVLAAPMVAVGELHALLVLAQLGDDKSFGPSDLARASVFADFATRAVENAMLFERVESLLAQARVRETERAELSRRVVSAEQDERRRLSLQLHDGPLSSLSGVGMMLDAAVEDVTAGRLEPALQVLETARQRQRGVIRSLRELCFALEPWVLRDQGFVTAVRALADEFERGHSVRIVLEVDPADALSPDDQVCLYQIVREAVANAIKHARPSTVAVTVSGMPADGFRVTVADDGTGFSAGPDDGLPHHGMASMRERAAILRAELTVESVPGSGTTVSLTMPAAVVDAA